MTKIPSHILSATIPPAVMGMTANWLLSLISRHNFIQTIAFLVLLAPAAQCLWPIPRSLQTGTTALKLSPDFTIKVNFQDAALDLSDAILRTKSYLINDKLQVIIYVFDMHDMTQ